MQLADTIEERTRIHQPGEDLLKQAMAGQHWIAIGDEAQEEQMTNAGRRVHDGILFRVAVSVARRRLVALVDSGASQSYIFQILYHFVKLIVAQYKYISS